MSTLMDYVSGFSLLQSALFSNSEFLTLYYLTVVDYHQKCLTIEIQLAGFSVIKYRHYVVSIEEKKPCLYCSICNLDTKYFLL